MPDDSDSGFPAEELKKFSESGRVISGAMDTSVVLWARAEAGVILKAWAGKTKVGTEQKMERRGLIMAYRQARRDAGFFAYKGGVEPGQASVNLGIRGPLGRVWYRTRGASRKFMPVYGGGFTPMFRIPNADWPGVHRLVETFRASYKAIVASFKGSIGLSRQSVIQIADDLGIDLATVPGRGVGAEGIAKARAAMATNGQYYRNGYGVTGGLGREFFVTLVNRYPKAGRLFMDATLMDVIAGRISYFRRNLEEGTFLSASKAAKAYPYLEVLRTAA